MSHLKLGSIGVLTALLTMAAHAAPAHEASANIVVNQVRIHYGDLNVQSASGAETLVARIVLSAKQACGGMPDYRRR